MKAFNNPKLLNHLILTLIIFSEQSIFIVSTLHNSVQRAVENTFIITTESSDLPSELITKMGSLGAQFHSVLDGVGVAIVTSDHPDFAAEIANIGGIRSVAPDFQIQQVDPMTTAQQFSYTNPPFSGDDDFFFDLQWGLDAINAIEAWNLGYRGSGTIVAVLDNGFDLTHPDLQSQIDFNTSKSFVPEESLQFTGSGLCHGCHIAGIIAAADNGVGIIGVAPEARLMLLKVLSDNGTSSFSWTLDAIVYAVNRGANIINMSFGIYLYNNDSYLDTINRVTEYAHKKGATLIAAAGNDAFNRSSDPSIALVPADASKVLSISATAPVGWARNPLRTNFDNIASYSNYGDPYIDFAAPGGDTRYTGTDESTLADVTSETSMFDLVISATNDGGWAFANGTSMAAAYASGIAALLIGKHGGSLDPEVVECVLADSSVDLGAPGRDAFFGRGRLDAYKAVTVNSQL